MAAQVGGDELRRVRVAVYVQRIRGNERVAPGAHDTSYFSTTTAAISELPSGPVGPMVSLAALARSASLRLFVRQALADCETGIACELRQLKETHAYATR